MTIQKLYMMLKDIFSKCPVLKTRLVIHIDAVAISQFAIYAEYQAGLAKTSLHKILLFNVIPGKMGLPSKLQAVPFIYRLNPLQAKA